MEIEEKERAEKKKRGAKATAVCLAVFTLLPMQQNSVIFWEKKEQKRIIVATNRFRIKAVCAQPLDLM